MYLKTLTLKGFKSFAEPASIRLEPGVTVVVGPNGSGKSNVVDAVAWVLGAQAPSTVRSARMDDVIFAGTALKPPLGRAEVTLTIDNSDGVLPLALSEVSITRILTRSGESSYALNGVPCRLLDISELLSDTGVGRQQHVIVSQSQIDAVLNARVGERREIVEEAAGVLKYRKRRDRAERRLSATDGDLTRISDLLREVRSRLRPLKRQAEAARCHADLLAEMQALRVHLASREIAGLRQRLREHKSGADLRSARRAELSAELDELNTAISESELRLAEHGVDDHSRRLARLEGLRARAEGIEAVLEERRRSIERERSMLAGQDMAAGLSAETSQCRSELDIVTAAIDAAMPVRRELDRLSERLASDRARLDAQSADTASGFGGEAAEAAAAASARGELTALKSALESGRLERRRLAERLDASDERLAELAEGVQRYRGELFGLNEKIAPLRESSAASTGGLLEARAALDAAAAACAGAREHFQQWSARREALSMALEESNPAPPSHLIEASDGVVGLLADLVDVEAGADAAFAAAVGDAVAAVVVQDAAAARRLLRNLEDSDTGAAVIVLDALGAESAGAARLAAACSDAPGVTPLRHKVRGRDASVQRMLDILLGAAVLSDGDWGAAVEVSVNHPDLVVVTPAGDRLSRVGWRLGVHAAAGIRAALHEATEREREAARHVEQAEQALHQARADIDACEQLVEHAAQRLAAAASAAEAVADTLNRAESEHRDLDAATSALREHFSETEARLKGSETRCAQLEARLPELQAAADEALRRRRQASEERAELDRRTAELAEGVAEQRAVEASLAQRRTLLEARLVELDSRLAAHEASKAAAGERLAAMQHQSDVLASLARALTARASAVNAALAVIRESHRRHSEQVTGLAENLQRLRQSSADARRRLDELASVTARADVEEAELRTLLQGSVERLRDDYGMSPAQAAEQPEPELPEGFDAARRADHLSAELEVMGPVNPLALAEYDELSERHELLRGQLDDVKAARRDLNSVIRSIDAEIEAVFSAAFADVSANFELLFESLFPGGEGRLALTDPDDLLNTGIDVFAKPSGKNVKRLSLLSGGERSLAALAFLFAVFRSRPSPFYVMDEVEAALDDVNLHRFLKLVDEFRADAQLVIVTHQKRTMEAADCLHGVSMKPGGSSVVVSERVADAA